MKEALIWILGCNVMIWVFFWVWVRLKLDEREFEVRKLRKDISLLEYVLRGALDGKGGEYRWVLGCLSRYKRYFYD